ncbi:hypothetical protein [Haloferula sp. BvORR071]|uniref:hypothetical protein n=1 Tax=Haloferula sp. BvORR071 TaxID=1396141 RepID=UPI000552E7E3|nr:hypothetical protein [Haloferula sp. BvORR071]
MPIVREYAMQSIFAAAQAMVIVAGSLMTAAVLQTHGYPDAKAEWRWLPVFVREWGLALMLVPAAWVLTTLWLERHRDAWFTKRWTILSGSLLLAGLVGLMVYAYALAGSVMTQMNPPG